MMVGTNRLLVFRLQGSRYALDLSDVAEVMEPPVIFPIPRAPHFLSGIMNFHGNLVSVLDLAHFLGISSCTPAEKVLIMADGEIKTLSVGNLLERLEENLIGNF